MAVDDEDEDLYEEMEDDNSAEDEDDEKALLRALAMSKDPGAEQMESEATK